MRQIFFTIPFTNIPVYGYGVMMVLGFIVGMYLAQFLARRSKQDPEVFANAAILALITGVLGARLSHVVENFHDYIRPDISAWQNFVNAINIREGGLTYYGGFLLAFPTLVLYAKWKKVPLPLGMDIIAPCLMVGLAFGRIGCYLNGCCYGAACDLKWAVQFPYGSEAYVEQFTHNELKMPVPRELIRDHYDNHYALGEYMDQHEPPLKQIQEPLPPEIFNRYMNSKTLKDRDQIQRESITADGKPIPIDEAGHTLADLAAMQHANPVHPAEIYSSITAFLIAAFSVAYFTLPHVPGRVFASMMIIEGAFRYVLEMLRVEPAKIGRGTSYLTFLPPQSYSMVISFTLVVGGTVLWYVFGRMARKVK